MFEWPWTKARKRREAEAVEAERVAKLLREEKERRAAQILADQIRRGHIAAMHRSQSAPARPASVTPIKATGYGLTAQRAAQEDQRKRDEEDARKRRQSSDSTASNDYGLLQAQASFSPSPEMSNEVSKMTGGGGTFDGGGASGDWSSDSGSSSTDSSSSSSDSGSSSSGGSD